MPSQQFQSIEGSFEMAKEVYFWCIVLFGYEVSAS